MHAYYNKRIGTHLSLLGGCILITNTIVFDSLCSLQQIILKLKLYGAARRRLYFKDTLNSFNF